MFVKIIRNKAEVVLTEIYEPRKLEFRKVSEDEKSLTETASAKEELLMIYNDGYAESILLFDKDEVWLTSDTGKTVDRWTI
jgi:hypothetical protein